MGTRDSAPSSGAGLVTLSFLSLQLPLISQSLQPGGCAEDAEAGSQLPGEPQDQALDKVGPGESSSTVQSSGPGARLPWWPCPVSGVGPAGAWAEDPRQSFLGKSP